MAKIKLTPEFMSALRQAARAVVCYDQGLPYLDMTVSPPDRHYFHAPPARIVDPDIPPRLPALAPDDPARFDVEREIIFYLAGPVADAACMTGRRRQYRKTVDELRPPWGLPDWPMFPIEDDEVAGDPDADHATRLADRIEPSNVFGAGGVLDAFVDYMVRKTGYLLLLAPTSTTPERPKSQLLLNVAAAFRRAGSLSAEDVKRTVEREALRWQLGSQGRSGTR